MALPDPEIGLVVHFTYLWKREQSVGLDYPRYARPCAIILAHRRDPVGALQVLVAPITHSQPGIDTTAIEIPVAVKKQIGLDDARSWIVTNEVNEFAWPGYDLQLNAAGEFSYGILPNRFFERVRDSVLTSVKAQRLARVQP